MYWLGLIMGFVIGSIMIPLLIYAFGSDGTLRIDHSNPEKDIYRFELDALNDLSKAKRIVLKVDNNANLSQK